MRSSIRSFLAGVALLGTTLGSAAFGAEGETSWFFEDAASFSSNTYGRWSYSPSVAHVDAETKTISIVPTGAESVSDEVSYKAPGVQASVQAVTLESSNVVFKTEGSTSVALTPDTTFGIQVVESSSGYVFAIFEPLLGIAAWRETSVAASLEASYDVIFQFVFDGMSKSVTYLVRTGDGTVHTLGTVELPATATLPTVVDYSGEGSFKTLSGVQTTGEVLDYSKWSYAHAIMTWRGVGTSETALDLNASEDAKFCAFKLTDGVWADDASVLWQGGASKTYSNLPGYSGATHLWKTFSRGNYSAPGYAVRFSPASAGTYAGSFGLGASDFAVGGLVVERGATGYGLKGTLSSAARKVLLGDPTAAAASWFWIGEDFTIEPNGGTGSETRFFGTANVAVADGKTLSVMTSDTQPLVLDETTAAVLKMQGKGQLACSTLTAKGNVTLDYSALSVTRNTPFVRGNILVDASTRLAFPADFASGTSFTLCSGAVSGLSAGVRTVIVGGVETNVYLDVSGSTVTRGDCVARATVDGTKNWTALAWETGAEFHPGLSVDLTFTPSARLVFSTTPSVATMTIRSTGAATVDFSASVPTVSQFAIAEGTKATFVGGATSAARKTLDAPIASAGDLALTGFLQLNGSLSGAMSVVSNATVTLGSAGVLTSDLVMDVLGTLDCGSAWTVCPAGAELRLHAGSKVLASGAGALSFAAAGSGLKVVGETSGGAAAVLSAPLQLTASPTFEVAAGQTLEMANATWYENVAGAGFVKTGDGLLTFAAAAKTDYASAVTISQGPVQLVDGGTFLGPLTLAAGATLVATAGGSTVSGAFIQEGALRIDCSALSGETTILTVPNGSAFTVGNIFATSGDWSFTVSGNSLKAIPKTASDWNYAPAMFTFAGASGTEFQKSTYKVYNPVTKTETGVQIVGNVASTVVPGHIGETLDRPWAIFTTSPTATSPKSAFIAPGYVMRFTSDTAGQTIAALLYASAKLKDEFHFGGLLFEDGASDISFYQESDASCASTCFGDPRTANGVATRFEFNESFSISRKGSFTLYGTLDFHVASGCHVVLNATRDSDKTYPNQVFQPTLNAATHATLRMHGLGTLGVRTLIATGDVTLDYGDLAKTRTTPYIAGAAKTQAGYTANTGNLAIDDETNFRLPSWLAENTAYQLCYGTLYGAVSGVRKITVGSDTFYANVTFTGNKLAYSKSALNVATVTGGSTVNWDSLDWNGGEGWREGRPVLIAIEGEGGVNIFQTDSQLTISSLTFDGQGVEHEVGYVSQGTESSVAYVRGATRVDVTFTWIGPASGGTWETAANWSCGGVPYSGEDAYFIYSAEVTANKAFSARIHVASGATVNLADMRSCVLTGVVGPGRFVKTGPGMLVMVNGSDGMAFDRADVTVQNGSLVARGGTLGVKESLAIDSTLAVPVLTDENGGLPPALTAVGGAAMLTVRNSNPLLLGCSVGAKNASESWALQVLTGVLVFDTGASVTNVARGVLSGAGCIGVRKDAALDVLGDTVPAGGFAGSGLLRFLSTSEPARAIAETFQQPAWRGTLWLSGVAFDSFSPDTYGNAGSVLRLSNCSGYFRPGCYRASASLVLDGEGTAQPALRITDGQSGDAVTLSHVIGHGELRVDAARPSEGAIEISALDIDSFDGSYTVSDGGLTLQTNVVATIGTNSIWTAAVDRTIDLLSDSVVTNSGTFAGPAAGAGTVVYSGVLDETKIEGAAKFYQSDWTGTVRVVDAELAGARLDLGGNEGSSLVLENVEVANLPAQEVTCPVTVVGDGMTIASASAKVVFAKVLGMGAVTAAENGSAVGGFYRFDDVLSYTGAVSVLSGGVCVGIGEQATERDAGTIVYGEGASVRSGLGWNSCFTSFGTTLSVMGTSLEEIFSVPFSHVSTCELSDYQNVRVSLPETGGDEHLVYRLSYSSSDENLYIVGGNSPPYLEIEDLKVKYGVDMTNATLFVAVRNYWRGSGYEEGAIVRVTVKDGSRVVAVLAGRVNANGVFEIGSLALPHSDGRDYTYEIEVLVRENEFKQEETLSTTLAQEPAAHSNAHWYCETPLTFPLPQAEKTGRWYWNDSTDISGHIFLTDDRKSIRVTAAGDDDAGIARYAANRPATGIVRTDSYFAPDFAAAKSGELPNMQGALRLLPDANLVQVYNADEGTYEDILIKNFVAATNHHLRTTFNYVAGTVSYELDGEVLVTGLHPDGLFPLTEEQKAANELHGVAVAGTGTIQSLTGDEYGTNMVQTVIDGVTNEYRSVDEAIAAMEALGANVKLQLLWDASWRPIVDSVGRTYRFENGGYGLYIDPSTTNALKRQGYRVIDNGDGSYTIGVFEYSVSFDPAAPDTTGVMPAMTYSVTNMVFALVSNKFERAHHDFTKWGDALAEETAYTNCATIDMTHYGLTNLTLFARWTEKVRTVLVESTNEYVYIEAVLTNGVEHANVTYVADEDPARVAKGLGRALIPVTDGSDLVIRFSTDIEKSLEFDEVLSNQEIAYDFTIDATTLPLLGTPVGGIHYWAILNNIPLDALANSVFANSSYQLNRHSLMTEASEVAISDFRVTDNGCTFKVTIDGEPLNDASKIGGMVKYSTNLATGDWQDATDVSVGADGTVSVVTPVSKSFVKIVIPENEK